MEPTIHTITLDLQRPCKFGALTVKKGDTHRQLRLRLLSGGSPYEITEDCYGVFTAQKPDGTVLYNACTREGNTLVYQLTPQTTAAAGTLECEVKLYGLADALLTSATFTLQVEDTVYTQGDDAITSTGEATALTQLITQAEQTVERMEKLLENGEDYAVIDNTELGDNAWSGKHTVDKLCPAFTETGDVAACAPVAGYPLGVVSVYSGEEPGQLNLYHGGKNLFDDVAWFESNGFTKQSDGSWQAKQVNKTCWINTTKKKGTVYLTAIAKTDATAYDPSPCYFLVYYTDGTDDVSFSVKDTNGFATLTSETNPNKTVDYIKWTFGGGGTYYIKNMQISFVDDKYEPYRGGQTFTVDLTNAPYDGGPNTYDWETGLLFNGEEDLWYQHDLETGEFVPTEFWAWDDISQYPAKKVRSILAVDGVNCLFSYSDTPGTTCETRVRGKADPVAIIEKLTNAILALGGNV